VILARLLSLLLLVSAAQTKNAPDHWIGTWHMVPAKSHYEAGVVPKSRILSFVAVPGGMKVASDLLDEVGIVHIEFEAQYGGPDVPMRGGNPGPMMSIKRMNAYTFDTFQKVEGKVVVTTHFVVSMDGKTLTSTATGLDGSGKKYTNVSVYQRQP
jgi:hypothetical protein